MKRVELTLCVLGLTRMQVCAVADATDAEILDVCNRENPSGTANGWTTVIRGDDPETKPRQCARDDQMRLHLMVAC